MQLVLKQQTTRWKIGLKGVATKRGSTMTLFQHLKRTLYERLKLAAVQANF